MKLETNHQFRKYSIKKQQYWYYRLKNVYGIPSNTLKGSPYFNDFKIHQLTFTDDD